jgi:hypothetical protein
MIFIVIPPYDYFVCILAEDNARGVPDQCGMYFQRVRVFCAVFLLHEGVQDITAEEWRGEVL